MHVSRGMRVAMAGVVLVLAAKGASAGSVTGTVKYEGTVPKLAPIKMDADPECLKKHGGQPVAAEMLLLGAGNTVGNVFVYVKSGLPAGKSYPAPSSPIVMDQKGCQYHPHVMGVMVGQPFKILNSDAILHNVHAMPAVNQQFNEGMPANRTEAVHTFSKAEAVFKIKCDVHPWMSAYVAVMTHPFFSITAADGKFKIDNLPAGTYTVEAWHERLPVQTASVTVGASDSKTVDFKLAAPSK